MSLIVGLTGGIGSGKSSAARIFADLGAAVIDTDEIAHRLTQPGQPALSQVRKKLGARFFRPDGSLDRTLMRKTVFSEPGAKQDLEAILHPLIRKKVDRVLAAVKMPYTVLVVPLLFETGAYDALIQRTLVVDCTEDKQIERVIARSGISAQEARAIISAQVPRAVRIAGADDVLDNNGPAEHLSEQVAELHRKYLGLAGETRN